MVWFPGFVAHVEAVGAVAWSKHFARDLPRAGTLLCFLENYARLSTHCIVRGRSQTASREETPFGLAGGAGLARTIVSGSGSPS